MPYTFPNGSNYYLVLLDTNALSEISKDINGTRIGFIRRFPLNKYAPCFSAYNLFEIHNADRAYQSFINCFSNYPCLILHPYLTVIREEIQYYNTKKIPSIIINAFVPYGPDKSYDLASWLNGLWQNKELVLEIKKNASEYPDIASGWEKQRRKTIIYTKDFETDCLRNFLFSIHAEWILNNTVFNIEEFPGARMMLFSQYMRIHRSKKSLGANDVNDVMISSALPYLDAVITENYQAEVIKQAKSKIFQLKDIEIVTLSEIRMKVSDNND